MKNFNNKLTLVVALASIISVPMSADFLPRRGILGQMVRGTKGAVKGFNKGCGNFFVEAGYQLGLVGDVDYAAHQIQDARIEITDELKDVGVEVTADFLKESLPVYLQKRINTKNLVKAGSSIMYAALLKAAHKLGLESKPAGLLW